MRMRRAKIVPPMSTWQYFLMRKLNNSNNFPPSSASRMRMRRAKIVPPMSAIGPRTDLAATNTVMMVRTRVRVVATSPLGGQKELVYLFSCSCDFVLDIDFLMPEGFDVAPLLSTSP